MDIRVEDTSTIPVKLGGKTPPCTLVIFGAGGDLTKRLLMPAIYNLAKAKLLSEKFAIIAVDRTPKPVRGFVNIWRKG
jgi:glucose-6-phosphate 1-dehydrogenase